MEKKNNGGLIAIIVILLVALLGVIFYVAYDKGLIFSNDNKIEDKDVSTNEEKELDTNDAQNVVKDEVNKEQVSSNQSYYTDGNYYYLILYPETTLSQVSNASSGKQDKSINSFYLALNGGYTYDVLYGQYEISNGKLKLSFIGNTYNEVNNVFNIALNKVSVQSVSDSSHFVTLDYSEDKVVLGNFELLKK